MSNKIIATSKTYDPQSLTSTGYDATLYSDGSIALEGRSRWQGSTTGDRYRSEPGTVDVSGIDEGDQDNDAEAALSAFLATFDPRDLPSPYTSGSYGFRRTRKGYRVQ